MTKKRKTYTAEEVEQMVDLEMAITFQCGTCQSTARGSEEINQKFITRKEMYADDNTNGLIPAVMIECRNCRNKEDLILEQVA